LQIRDFIGIPYKSHGYDFDGVDCYGLAHLFNKHMLGKDLPDYKRLYSCAHDLDQAASAFKTGVKGWSTVTNDPKLGDVILFRDRGVVTHCGIYIDMLDFLHIREGQTSTVEALRGMAWERIMEGIMRWN